jgi:hypothetical protein
MFTWELISRSFLVGNVVRPCQEWPQKIRHEGKSLRFLLTYLIWRNCKRSFAQCTLVRTKRSADRIKRSDLLAKKCVSIALTTIIISLLALISYFLPVKVKFNLLNPTGHVMHQQFNIQKLYVLPTLHLCVLYI